jgi:hypothetical protein
MHGIKTDDHVSERLLSIDWGKPDSERNPAAPQRELAGCTVSVRIDEVFHSINAYRAMLEHGSSEGLLARSLIAQANAIFNQAFLNLEQRHRFHKFYVGAPVRSRYEDVTDLVIEEVRALQNILDT